MTAETSNARGWVLVPRVPTPEMLAATSWPGCAASDYAHMLAAAPQPPSAPVGVDAPGSRAWMAEVCRAAALSLAAHGVRNDQLSKVADWIAQQPAAGAAMEFDGTDREVLREFIRICREHKPVGPWPGERVCKAIERAMDNEKPFRFIAEADMAPERAPSMKDADRMLSGPRRAAQQPAAASRSTHRVWRANDWLPCYCAATSDHHIGNEQPAAVGEVAELVGLLDEVRSHFTRDDDLPDDLLPRIDAALAAQRQEPTT